MPLTPESDLAKVVEQILSEILTGEATYAELYKAIEKRIVLTPEDLAPSQPRYPEPMWKQRVRNIRSHKDVNGNGIFEGIFVAIPGGLKLASSVKAA